MRTAFIAIFAVFFAATAYAQPPASQQLAREIYKELIEINTTDSSGSTTAAAEAVAKRLREAGFPAGDVQVIGAEPRKGNLVARLHGTGVRRPILLLAHLDVVEVRREEWSVDPFKLTEKDGYFYARGSSDDKAMAAILVANLIRYKQEKLVPERDIILALTADEELENSPHNGIDWLLKNHRGSIDAEFALNEGGGVTMKNGKALANRVQASEKVSVTYRLEAKYPGGHSATPGRETSIYLLADALTRLSKNAFPVKLTEATRAYFEKMAALESGQDAEDIRAVVRDPMDTSAASRLSTRPSYNAQLRTTCVATRLDAGQAVNAVPQAAYAIVNCRVIPGEPVAEVQQRLVEIISNDKVMVTPIGSPILSPPSPLRPDLLRVIEKLTADFWPGTPVIPSMSAGMTDSRHLRNAGIQAYGHSGLAGEPSENRAHGIDERLSVKSFYDGLEYLYKLVRTLAAGE